MNDQQVIFKRDDQNCVESNTFFINDMFNLVINIKDLVKKKYLMKYLHLKFFRKIISKSNYKNMVHKNTLHQNILVFFLTPRYLLIKLN